MEQRIGQVTHYFDRIRVAVLDLSGELKVGDTIHIQGRDVDFAQGVQSMEIEHEKVQVAGPGAEVALQVIQPVRKGDAVFKVITEQLP
jgi:putative protease